MKNWIKITVGSFDGTPSFVVHTHLYIDPIAVAAVQSADYREDPSAACVVILESGNAFVTNISAEDMICQIQSALP